MTGRVAAEIVAWMLAAGLLGVIVGAGLARQRITRLRVQLLQRPVLHLDRRRSVLVDQLDQAVELSARKDRLIVALEDEIDLLGRLLELKDEETAHTVRASRVLRAPERDEIRRRMAIVRRMHAELGDQLAGLAGTIDPAQRASLAHRSSPATAGTDTEPGTAAGDETDPDAAAGVIEPNATDDTGHDAIEDDH